MKTICALALLFFTPAVLVADDDTPPNFQRCALALSTSMRGWSGKKPDGPMAIYSVTGVSFMTATSNGGIASSQSWDLDKPPSLTDARSDPLKLVEYACCLTKKGDHGGVLKLLDPSTPPETLVELTRADLVQKTDGIYADKVRGHVLLAFAPDSSGDIVVAYLLEGPTNFALQVDAVRKIGDTYAFASGGKKEMTNGPHVINVATALYDAMHGKPGEIKLVPAP